jgi:hypothetical protein
MKAEKSKLFQTVPEKEMHRIEEIEPPTTAELMAS